MRRLFQPIEGFAEFPYAAFCDETGRCSFRAPSERGYLPGARPIAVGVGSPEEERGDGRLRTPSALMPGRCTTWRPISVGDGAVCYVRRPGPDDSSGLKAAEPAVP